MDTNHLSSNFKLVAEQTALEKGDILYDRKEGSAMDIPEAWIGQTAAFLRERSLLMKDIFPFRDNNPKDA